MSKPASVAMIEFSPSQRAQLLISQLASDPDLMQTFVVGPGRLTPEEKNENRRRRALYREKRLAIIKECGVAQEYLRPLLEEEASMRAALTKLQQDIADLRAIA